MPLSPNSDEFAHAIASLRRFARRYMNETGLLRPGVHGTALSISEGRILYELHHARPAFAAEIGAKLNLDRAQLSRTLARFERLKWIERQVDVGDRRRARLILTTLGRTIFEGLNRAVDKDLAALLNAHVKDRRHHLVAALKRAEQILAHPHAPPIRLRPHQPGDLGWIVHRHGVLYAQEYGWDGTFEALVAEVVTHFAKHFDPASEACWMAERDEILLGSVMLIRKDSETAKLRLLYVEPEARGLGLGGQLVDECIAFATERGYRRISLWTNDVLSAACALYIKRGFTLTQSEPHFSFGHDLIGQTWVLELPSS